MKSKKERAAYQIAWYRAHRKARIAASSVFYRTHRKEKLAYSRARNLEAKLKVLTHYGNNGRLQCCWADCETIDSDMLTLDHILNNGAQERKQQRHRGSSIHFRLIEKNFPEGYQTLCWNHQWKKETMRRREEADKS